MATEKLLVLGATHSKGIGKETNEPYEMRRAIISKEMKSVNRPNRTVIAYGVQAEEMDVTPTAFDQISKLELPKVCAVEMDFVKNEKGFRNGVITKVS